MYTHQENKDRYWYLLSPPLQMKGVKLLHWERKRGTKRVREGRMEKEGGRELVHDSVLFLAHSTYKRETSITEPSFDMGLTLLMMAFKHLIFHCPQSFCLWHFTIFPVETLCLTLALFCSILTTLSSERFSPHLSQSARRWVTVRFGRCSAYPPLLWRVVPVSN